MIAAIETKHNGLAFRSRLEARWAVFFDALGIAYQYELQGYEAYGQRYLPDFWLPELQVFAETKGDRFAMAKDQERMFSVIANSGFLRGTDGLILLGDIPRLPWGLVFHPILKHQGGDPLWTLCWFTADKERRSPVGLQSATKNDEYWIAIMTGVNANERGWEPQPVEIRTTWCWSLVLECYEKARQERF